MALAETPDLIVLDINMPRMTGYEVISKLRMESATQNVPIVALSANSASGDRDETYELGCGLFGETDHRCRYVAGRHRASSALITGVPVPKCRLKV